MCLVVVAWQQDDKYPLIVAGNRDEFHQRPTEAAKRWADHDNITGGRDLQAGGTWLGVHDRGRFATVTNFRDAEPPSPAKRSRGHLVTEFLLGDLTPLDFLQGIDGTRYAGFNLLLSDGDSLGWLSNRGGTPRLLDPGVYGLSNALLDSPWHKVVRTKAALESLIGSRRLNETELFRLLDDRTRAPVGEVDDDRLPFDKAHAMTAPFIVQPDYGTRSSSVVLAGSDGQWRFVERRYDAVGRHRGTSAFRLAVTDTPTT